MARFTVDTHLFRELGELLVGRDSTALIELIKNAYDADASEAVIYAESLDNTERGFITVTDNGVGMTSDEFEKGFLRIASRIKDSGVRRSKKYHRQFTGAKGIGRLAAHKLARFVRIQSIPWQEKYAPLDGMVEASIDWDKIEKCETLDDIEETDAVQVGVSLPLAANVTGTTITLQRLRRRWTSKERGQFLLEVQTFAPPVTLVSSPKKIVGQSLLFEEPKVRDSQKRDPGFNIKLEGDFIAGDDQWQRIAEAASWIIEIDARSARSKVRYAIAPTQRTKDAYPAADVRRFEINHPDQENGPHFQARILIREGALPATVRDWARRAAGIRVYMEGFRILPYGEPRNDWLGIDADYTRRQRSLSSPETDPFADYFEDEAEDTEKGLLFLNNNAYFGAVFLMQGDAALKMLVNREGFVPEASFEQLVDLVRKGIDLSVRVRAAATRGEREERRNERASGKKKVEPDDLSRGTPLYLRQVAEESLARAKSITTEARQLVASGDLAAAADTFTKALSEFETATQAQEKRISESAMLRVLASVGTQLASFIHEIRSLLGMAEVVETTLAQMRTDTSLSHHSRQELAKLQASAGDLRRSLERQASYLLDVITPDSRRRRIRQSLAERFDAGARLVAHLAEKRTISIANEIPTDLKSPPMFPAELTTVFSNLLSNAVKAAGNGGRIRALGSRQTDGSVIVTVENTGVKVNLQDSERWFKPFESTTEAVDPVLGQGMGLGLPITRSILEEYGADIKFVRPAKGYSTAIQITFPK